ncbi:MAG: anaerobic ribonucleoside-triphosphate reductase [Planctomycetia bacterium]
MNVPRQVRKRDGRLVAYDRRKIAEAIFRAAEAVGGSDRFLAEQLAGLVEALLARAAQSVPGIEDVQDAVEKVLIEAGHARTAKAYILYREQRAQRRHELGEGGAGALPQVGGTLGLAAGPFRKGELAAALVREDGLPAPEADEVARAVEERLLASRLRRVDPGLVAALVRAEMFARGHDSRVGRVERVEVERQHVRAALGTGQPGVRAASPGEAAQALGERVMAEHLLSEVLPAPVAEAHRLGDLHLYDLGQPLALTALTLPAARLLERHLWGEGTTRARGLRRAVAALRRAVSVAAPFAARTLALEDVNVLLAPYTAPLDDEALREELRELVLSPELAAFPGRSGQLALELVLSAEGPARLAGRAVPPPAPPGLCYGQVGDEALRVARLLLREQRALRAAGRRCGPDLTLAVPRGAGSEPALRALVREALAGASEVGEPRVVFEQAGRPSRGSRWLRGEEGEGPDPLRFDHGDVSVASAAAVNLVSAAVAGEGVREAALAEVGRLAGLAVQAALARRALLGGGAAEPGGALWSLAREEHPLVDLAGAWHVLEPVGAARAASLLLPGPGREDERAALAGALVERLARAALEAAQPHDLPLVLVEAPVEEAALRLAGLDRERVPGAQAWWEGHDLPSYRPAPGGSPGVRREPAWARRAQGGPWRLRVRHRVDSGGTPLLDDLLAAFEDAGRDQAVVESAVDPWPRRRLRGETGGA